MSNRSICIWQSHSDHFRPPHHPAILSVLSPPLDELFSAATQTVLTPSPWKYTSTNSHGSAAAVCYVHNFCLSKQMPASLNIRVHLYSCEVFPKELKATLHLGAREWVNVCCVFFLLQLQSKSNENIKISSQAVYAIRSRGLFSLWGAVSQWWVKFQRLHHGRCLQKHQRRVDVWNFQAGIYGIHPVILPISQTVKALRFKISAHVSFPPTSPTCFAYLYFQN